MSRNSSRSVSIMFFIRLIDFVAAKLVNNCFTCKKNGLQKCAKDHLQTFAKEKIISLKRKWHYRHKKKEALASSFLFFVFLQRNGETEYGAFAFDGFDVSITTVLARKVLT